MCPDKLQPLHLCAFALDSFAWSAFSAVLMAIYFEAPHVGCYVSFAPTLTLQAEWMADSFAQDFLAFVVVRFHLTQDHPIIRSTGVHELFVVSALDHAPVLHQQNQIGAADGGEAMSDHEGGPSGEQSGH